MTARRRWIDRTRPLWRIGNRIEAFQLRRIGHSPMSLLNPGSVLLIETTGRRTGRQRFAPVGYLTSPDGSYVVGGGAAGMTEDPDWVRNLRSSPTAAVWIRRERTPVTAVELLGAARDDAMREAAKTWPGVTKYEASSGRPIPYFRLTPTAR